MDKVQRCEPQQVVTALEARGMPTKLLVFDVKKHGIIRLKSKLAVQSIMAES